MLFEYASNGTNTAYTLLSNTVLSQHKNWLTNYNLTDALGSVRVVADGAGQVVETLDYSAFGEPLFSDSVSTYQFAGERYDEITGLYYLRARSYSPELGRFLSRDAWAYDYQNPVELNRYVYGINNPTNYTDPSGYSISGFVTRVAQAVSISPMRQIAGVYGSIAGGVGSYLSSWGWYNAAYTGLCGDKLQDWAHRTDFGSFRLQSLYFGMVVGGVVGAFPELVPVMSLLGVTTSFLSFSTDPNICNLSAFILSILSGQCGTTCNLNVAQIAHVKVLSSGGTVVDVSAIQVHAGVIPLSWVVPDMLTFNLNFSSSGGQSGNNRTNDNDPVEKLKNDSHLSDSERQEISDNEDEIRNLLNHWDAATFGDDLSDNIIYHYLKHGERSVLRYLRQADAMRNQIRAGRTRGWDIIPVEDLTDPTSLTRIHRYTTGNRFIIVDRNGLIRSYGRN